MSFHRWICRSGTLKSLSGQSHRVIGRSRVRSKPDRNWSRMENHARSSLHLTGPPPLNLQTLRPLPSVSIIHLNSSRQRGQPAIPFPARRKVLRHTGNFPVRQEQLLPRELCCRLVKYCPDFPKEVLPGRSLPAVQRQFLSHPAPFRAPKSPKVDLAPRLHNRLCNS